jgi:undecaprenyl diphosphate synthase
MTASNETLAVLQPAPANSVDRSAVGDPSASAQGARYVAVIADGNRRWAQARGRPLSIGYTEGVDVAMARVDDAIALGVQEFTLFLWSTENWRRPQHEVQLMIALASRHIVGETRHLVERGVRVQFIGSREGLPADLVNQMRWMEDATAAGCAMKLFLAFNYGGRQEIEDAARALACNGAGELRDHLYAPTMHDPDLLIRTGGDKRLSDFMLWRLAYTELVFRDELWPDFTRQSFEAALAEFATRRRRFGGS